MKKQKLLLFLAVTMAVILTVAMAGAGTFEITPFTGDADSGIDSSITYTHLVDFNSKGGTTTINGVAFDNTGSYTLTGATTAHGSVTGTGIVKLTDVFIYNGKPGVLTVSGLTSGVTYKLRFYIRGWAGCPQDFSFDDTTPATVVTNISRGTDGNPASLDYIFTLAGGDTDLQITVASSDGAGTFHFMGFSNEEFNVGPVVNVISPKYGDVVDPFPADVDLIWDNIDPNVGDTVYVDVWFGTEISDDPNNPGDYEKVVSGLPVSSHTVTPDGPGVYYWQVNSYLNGDPATTSYGGPGEPNVVEGAVYMFTNDGPVVSVNAGVDMITWSGEPVGLAADVNDDGGSTLIYSWKTGEIGDGVSVVFDPSSSDPNPVITITKLPYMKPYATNGSFEDPVLGDEAFTYAFNNLPSWVQQWSQGTWTTHGWKGGAYNPLETEFVSIPDGENVGWVLTDGASDHGLFQVTDITIEAGKTYTLIAMVGNPSYNEGQTANHHIEIVGSGLAAASESAASPDPCEWTSVSVSYTAGADAVADPNVGQLLGIRLVAEKYIAGGYEVHFDDVHLQVEGEPAREVYDPSMSSVTVTLQVNDETNPAVSDSMTIDVYDNECLAARDGLGLGVYHPADFDGNCKTDILDLAEMAAKWLNDSSATITTVDK